MGQRQAAFITIEGGEGAGKSTQARLLAQALEARGLPVLLTREPGGSPGAERVRELLLLQGVAWSGLAEVFLHFAARAEHVDKAIRPALQSGHWVVSDRFVDSTMAYQGCGAGADREAIASLARMIGLVPDLTIVLDVGERTAAARLASRGGQLDRYETMPSNFHERVRQGFRSIAAAEPERCVLIDAEENVSGVHDAIMEAVQQRLFPVSRK